MPLVSLVNWLSKKIKRDGKGIKRLIKELVKEGYLLLHKGGQTISLNPSTNREIIEYIERILGK